MINYELSLSNHQIIISYDFFDTFEKNFNTFSPFEKEILSSIYYYYKFMKNDKSLNLFDKLFKELSNIFSNDIFQKSQSIFETRILKENDIFVLTVWYFYNKNINYYICFYTTIIFKSLTIKFDVEKEDRFEDSDVIINSICDLFEKFLIFNKIDYNYDFDYTAREMRGHFFAILEFLVIRKFLVEKKKWYRNELGALRSDKYWKIENYDNLFNFEEKFNIMYVKPRFRWHKNRLYLVSGYYHKVFEVFRKNVKSGLRFELTDYEYIDNMRKLKWFIDIEWFNNIIKIMREEFNINFDNIENDILHDLQELKKNGWKNSEIQSRLSKNYYYYNIYKFNKYVNDFDVSSFFYVPFYFDFRGRMYFESSVGVTSSKILRSIYYYGKYNEQDIHEPVDPIFNSILDSYDNELQYVKNKFEISTNSEKINTNILLLLISIGKFFIIKENVKIHMELFIKNAINFINNGMFNGDMEDKVELYSYLNILCNWKDLKKRTAAKDFTGSFFQHLTRLLGPSSIKTLELANMYNDLTWNDPYSHIIKDFLNSNPNLNFKKLFTRKNVKKVIMTIPYSIGEKSAWKYFAENLNNNDIENKNIKSEFKIFFKYTKNYLESDFFFKNSTDRLILYAITQAHWFNQFEITIQGGSAHLIYYKSKKKVIDLLINFKNDTIRITKKIDIPNKEEIDYESLAISVRANWIAVLDAECLRLINKTTKSPLFSIHDSVLIDWLNIDKLIINCNNIMKNNKFENITWDNYHDFKIFSFFIII
jgi:hypothetical protein